MCLKIHHRTEYSYDLPVICDCNGLQLAPQAGSTQAAVSTGT